MLAHLLRNCEGFPDNEREALQQTAQPATVSAHAPATYVPSQAPGHTGSSAVDQATLNLMLVELVVVCALPFAILDSVAFKDFVTKLAPGLKVPPRQYITQSLLQEATKVMRERVIAKLNEYKYVSLVTDSWSDPNGAKIVNFMLVAPEMPSLFWSSWASGSESQTADKLAEKVKGVVDEVERLTRARVVGVVTDNASNMVGMWARLSQFAIVGGGCAAHVLNLLMKDLFAHKSLKKVHSDCVQISRFVRDHTALLDTFRVRLNEIRASGGKRRGLTLPVPTRWYSVFNCLENVLASRDELFDLFTSSDHAELRQAYSRALKTRKKLEYITALVKDSVFWENLGVVVRMIRPIREAMGALESDKEFASGVYSWFRKLLRHDMYRSSGDESTTTGSAMEEDDLDGSEDPQEPEQEAEPSDSQLYVAATRIVQNDLSSFFRENIQERWKYVHTNAMAISFFLDPRCKFSDFEQNDERKTRDSMVQFAIDKGLIPASASDELKSEIFDFAAEKDSEPAIGKTSPLSYWKSMSRKFPVLGKIASIVFALPTSSAASERAWSIFNHIHTKKRNRLSVDKVELLVYIYINYGALKGEKVDLARHVSHPGSFDCEVELPTAAVAA